MNTGQTITNTGTFVVARATGTGTFTNDGGTVNVTGNDARLGIESSATGTIIQESGSFSTARDLEIGGAGTGTFTQNGGTVDIDRNVELGEAGGNGNPQRDGRRF